MTKFNKSQIYALVNYGLNAVLSLFINTFFVARILNISNNGLTNIAIFYLTAYGVLMVGYFLCSFLLKKVNKLYVYRSGIFLRLALIIFLNFLGEDLTKYLVLISALNGVVEAVYWSSYNSLRNEIVDKKRIKHYISSESIVEQLTRIVAPVLMGSAIDVFSFELVLALICIVSLAQVVFTFFVSNNKMSKNAFSVKKFFATLKRKNTTKSFWLLYLNFFLVA